MPNFLERLITRCAPLAIVAGTAMATTLGAQELPCAPGADAERLGVLVGRVLDSRSSAGVAGSVVTVHWRQTTIGSAGVEVAALQHIVRADSLGRFRACGLPHGVLLLAWAEIGEARSMPVELTLPERDSMSFEFRTPAGASAHTGDAPAPTARLRGQVRGADGSPVVGARVRLALGGSEVRTDAAGRFELPVVGPGPAQLDVVALGWRPERRWVTFPASGTADVDVTLAAPVRVLEEQRIVASSAFARDFERRRQRGSGYFMDRERIAANGGTALSDLALTFPGLQVRQGDIGRTLETLRRGSPCPIAVFLDGSPIDQQQLDAVVTPDQLYGIEYYPGFASPPVQYTASARSECGTLLLWTRDFAAGKKGKR